MVQFVENGPDIPEHLLDLHEEGKVVFFCGAGISMSAGLPDFKGLVEGLCEQPRIQTLRDPVLDRVKKLIDAGIYDEVIDVLEKDYVYKRNDHNGIGPMIKKILSPKKEDIPQINTHEALLKLSWDREENIKLVTTNFDFLFEEAITSKKYETNPIIAPAQTIPQNYRDGLIYLHGLISNDGPSTIQKKYLDDLVISARDYGQAYLSKGWAARFISELFQNYTVCFIGYSGNDVMVRYMIKARALDKKSSEIFAFAGYGKGEKEQKAAEWKEESITPILYPDDEQHVYLHKTLYEWAHIYQDGMYDKKKIINQHAAEVPPSINNKVSPQKSFFINRVLWAIIDEEASRSFANINPAPPLEWLEHFSRKRFEDEDWVKFGIIQNGRRVREDVASDLDSSNTLSRTYVTGTDKKDDRLTEVLSQLARWLRRHLNNPELVLWLSKQGGQLNEEFVNSIHREILHFDELKKEDQANENLRHKLQKIERDSPDTIPDSVMRTIWGITLSGRLKSYQSVYRCKIYDWCNDFNQNGLTLNLRMELRNMLTPYVNIIGINNSPSLSNNERETQYIKDIFYCRIILASGTNFYEAFYSLVINKREAWKYVSSDLAREFSLLLKDYLDLDKELGSLDELKDGSFWDMPSITDHKMDLNDKGWVVLTKLVYDTWLNTKQMNQRLAKRIVEDWQQIPYPLFKRLSFSAAVNSDVIEIRQAVDWLLADNERWFWSSETCREVIRLLVALSPKLSEQLIKKIEVAILKGPLHEKISRKRSYDYEIFIRLAKMKMSKAALSKKALYELNKLQNKHGFELEEDESDEFPAPRAETSHVPFHKPIDNPRKEITELCALVQKNEWYSHDWNGIFKDLNESGDNLLLKESWDLIAPVFCKIPDIQLEPISNYFGSWIRTISKILNDNDEDRFFSLIHHLLKYENNNLGHREYSEENIVAGALNHPVGYATHALINWQWYRQETENSESTEALHDRINSLFTKLCDVNSKENFRYGRLVLAAHVINLFQTDEDWTKEYLFPLFNWQESKDQAYVMWQGFLCQRQFYYDRLLPIIRHLKQDFLQTSEHEYYSQLGPHKDRFTNLLTQAALNRRDVFMIDEIRKATKNLPIDRLIVAIQTLTVNLKERDNKQKIEHWSNSIHSYLEEIWPQSSMVKIPEISRCMRELCMEADAAFPDAIAELKVWLQRDSDKALDGIFRSLSKTEHCRNFPRASLEFLDSIVDHNLQPWLQPQLKEYLNTIRSSDETLVTDNCFTRLEKINNKQGH